MRPYRDNFEAISVREESGISIINKWNLKSEVLPKVVLRPYDVIGGEFLSSIFEA